MAQGALKGFNKKVPAKSKGGNKPGSKVGAKGGKPLKKGAFNLPPKSANRLAQAREEQKITKLINRHGETVMAAKALQQQEKIHTQDLRISGKEMVRDIKRTALKRKKTRVEEKLIEAREKLARVEDKMDDKH